MSLWVALGLQLAVVLIAGGLGYVIGYDRGHRLGYWRARQECDDRAAHEKRMRELRAPKGPAGGSDVAARRRDNEWKSEQ